MFDYEITADNTRVIQGGSFIGEIIELPGGGYVFLSGGNHKLSFPASTLNGVKKLLEENLAGVG